MASLPASAGPVVATPAAFLATNTIAPMSPTRNATMDKAVTTSRPRLLAVGWGTLTKVGCGDATVSSGAPGASPSAELSHQVPSLLAGELRPVEGVSSSSGVSARGFCAAAISWAAMLRAAGSGSCSNSAKSGD